CDLSSHRQQKTSRQGLEQDRIASEQEVRGQIYRERGLGFLTNKRNGITALDIDSHDENVLSDALGRHGKTPIIIRTASEKWHGYYGFNGEMRRIRPWDGLPI